MIELMTDVQRNKKGGKSVDVAAVEHVKLLLLLRRHFWQIAPAWRRAFPDMAIWKHECLLRFEPSLDAWCQLQLAFTDGMRAVAKAMLSPSLGLPLGTSPGVLLGNAFLFNQVRPGTCDCNPTVWLMILAVVGAVLNTLYFSC